MLRERGMGEEGGRMAEGTPRVGPRGVGGKGEPDRQLWRFTCTTAISQCIVQVATHHGWWPALPPPLLPV
eukprot:9813516-Prorocentrum_lima.AAC.1